MYTQKYNFGKLIITMVTCLALFIFGACSKSSASTLVSKPTTGTTTAEGSVIINLVAQNMTFDKSTIIVPANTIITINFDNKDSGTQHNFSIYTGSGATVKIFVGNIITGPATTTYTFTSPNKAGTYFFRCDVHPTIMTGSFIVQ